jgi:8-oxo-dGTP diphosphatase
VEAPAQGSKPRVDVSEETIRAAGGVVWRRGDGSTELLLVHRPRYDDWSFPKGKCDADEPDEECALREIEEETGLRVSLGAELVSTEYESKGRPKRVRYWLVEVEPADDAQPQNEVDELAWLAAGEARDRLSYARDLDVLRDALEKLR